MAPKSWRIAAGILIFAGFFLITIRNADPDLFWHLRDGQQIIATASVPRTDTYSFTMPGFSWVDHEWSVEAGLWILWNNHLWGLAVFIFSLLAFAPFFFWLRRHPSKTDLFVYVSIATALAGFIGIRSPTDLIPALFSVFLSCSLHIMGPGGIYAENGILRSSPSYFLHGQTFMRDFFPGLILFGIFFFVDTGMTIYREKQIAIKEWMFGGIMLATSAIVALFNPYGARLYHEVFTVATSANTMK